MQQNKKIRLILSSTLLLLFSSVAANDKCYEAFADISLITRVDEDSCTIKSYDPPGTLISTDSLKCDSVWITEIGFYGRLIYQDAWLVKAFGNFGSVNSGDYKETVTTPLGGKSVIKADINNGSTRDMSIAVGYLHTFNKNFTIGPLVGWSYDYQRLKLKHAKTDGVKDPTLNGLNYTNRWRSPWIGFETIFPIFCISTNIGYEYHFANWHADWTLKGPDSVGGAFSDRRHAKNGYGQLVYIDTCYEIFDSWHVGIELRYQYWKATDGREVPRAGSFAAIGLNDTEVDKIPKATWQSFQLFFNLGCFF